MTKSDLADARRALLDDFLIELERAFKRREDETIRLCENSGGNGITPPPIEIDRFNSDTFKVVTEGLRAALDGKPDPFGLKTSSNYSKSRSKRVRSEVLSKVLRLNRSGVSLDEACAKCAPAGVSSETVKGWLKNKTERAWAEMAADERRKREGPGLRDTFKKQND